jgi:glycosyltransferase involved in cell wall biosynthesis
MTDPLGQSQVLSYLKGLSKKKYHFTLISFEKVDRFQKFGDEIKKITDSHHIDWYPLSYTKNPPVISTLYDIMRMYMLARRLHLKKKFSIVHCRGYITAMAGIWLKKKYGVRFLFDMRAFFADERVEGGLWNLNHPLYRLIYQYFKRREKVFLKESDYTISLTRKGAEIIREKICPDAKLNIEIIPCCADLDLFDYKRFNELFIRQKRKKLGIADNTLVVSYSGSVGTWYMLDEMLDFFKALLNHRPQSVFLFITNEPAAKIIAAATAKQIDTGKLIIHTVPYSRVPEYLMVSDVSVFFIKPVFSKMASSPTKQGEIMGMGIPLICNDHVGDTGDIVRDTECGWVINDFNEQEYAKAIEKINSLLMIDRDKIRQGAAKYYSLEKGIEKYASVYEKLLAH